MSRLFLAAAVIFVLQILLKSCGAAAPSGQRADGYGVAVSAAADSPAQTEEADGVSGGLLHSLAVEMKAVIYESFAPGIVFANQSGHSTFWLLQRQIDSLLPLYGILSGRMSLDQGTQQVQDFRTILMAEAEEGGLWEEEPDSEQKEDLLEEAEEALDELLRAENEAAAQPPEGAFIPRAQLQQVDLAQFADYEALVGQFYTIDANTMIGSDQLNLEKLLGEDMTVSREGGGPQILIYHTHSQEAFADSAPGEEADTIVGVGDRLFQILTEEYGYQVLHYKGKYDVETRDDAYSNALPDIERLLQENPSIEVVIDLHRDEMPEGTRLVMDVDGRPTARFMFFNGLSRTRKTGNIAYLYNENLDSNLAFSFQMQLKAMEYYPGLTRRIYLKGYRYNMHLCPKYLLIELGAQNNTVEEAMNACDPLAHILDLVLSGQ